MHVLSHSLSTRIFSVSSTFLLHYILCYPCFTHSCIKGGQKLDQYLTPNDKFVWATEGNPMRDCYQPSHPMSKISSVSYAKKDRILTQWLLLRYSPTHPHRRRMFYNSYPSIIDIIFLVLHPNRDTPD